MTRKTWFQAAILLILIVFLPNISSAQTITIKPIDKIGRQTITISDQNEESTIPCYQSHVPNKAHQGVDLGVIVFHGLSRNADDYFDRVKTSAKKADATAGTAIFTPQFLLEKDIEEHRLPGNYCFWTTRWNQGDLSLAKNSRAKAPRVSSFTFIDGIIKTLANKKIFPDMKTIVLIGHSSGGQLVNRYAAGNLGERSAAANGVRVRYVICNPSSYLYLDERRPVFGAADRYEVPQNADCKSFNKYKYGLDKLNKYMKTTGPDKIVEQYGRREVVYLLGEKDNDPNEKYLARDCAAMLQGKTRLERGLAYFKYLKTIYGPDVYKRHTLRIVPGVGHSSKGMFQSTEGLKAVFR